MINCSLSRLVSTSLIFCLLTATSSSSLAQGLTDQQLVDNNCASYPCWKDMMEDPNVHVPTAQAAFELYWQNHTYTKGGSYKVFKRWEYNAVRNMDENGFLPTAQDIQVAYDGFIADQAGSRATISNWTELGPFNLPTNGTGQPNGIGRINYIAFHPTNANKIYVGTPQGGFWLSEDAGNSWITTTDDMLTLGVSAIVVDHANPDRIYIGTGDRDSNDSPRKGVYVSDDGGYTWTISNTGMGNKLVGDMVMHPVDETILVAATNSGIFKSVDAGSNWSLTSPGQNFKNVVYHPTNPLIMYACSKGGTPNVAHFYKSIDGGDSWTEVISNLPTDVGRFVVGVSIDDPNRVYVIAANSPFVGFFRSDDSGDSFTLISDSPNILDYSSDGSGTGGQGWYDLCLGVDPLDADIVYVGGVNIFKSTDGGANWAINAHWVGSNAPDIHADQHWFMFSPHDHSLWSCNDGGLDVSPDGSSWSFTGNGIATAQIYKIGQSRLSTKLINGYQDNGTGIISSGGAWDTEIGGDGMECIIDPSTDQYCYGALYYGDIRRSANGGNNFSTIAEDGVNGIDESGAWVTPYILHEADPHTMFVGYKNVWRSVNVKTSSSGDVVWDKISDNLGGVNNKNIIILEHSPADNDILYMARTDKQMYRCDDINAVSPTWIDITSSSPNPSSNPTDIEAHPTDPNVVYMTQNKKVYKSSDKGANWVNITDNLPNVNMYCVLYDSSRTDGLYIATNSGIYFTDNGLGTWVSFSDGLPLTSQVNELDIYYDATNPELHRIRAGTYGRGLWESGIYSDDVAPTANFNVDLADICVGDVVQFSDVSAGAPTSWLWAGLPATYTYVGGTDATSQDPQIQFDAVGTYSFDLSATNLVGSDSYSGANVVVVNPAPTSSYTYVINGFEVTFTNTSVAHSGSSWDFGNGGASLFDSPIYTYPLAGTYIVTLDVTGTCGVNNSDQTITIDDPVDIEETGELSFVVSPNPAENELNIYTDKELSTDTELYLVNNLGQKVNVTLIVNGTSDISHLAKGFYTLVVSEDENVVFTQKILLK